jgi:hypothetical protein
MVKDLNSSSVHMALPTEIETASGRYVDLEDPQEADIDLLAIAHALLTFAGSMVIRAGSIALQNTVCWLPIVFARSTFHRQSS